MPLTEDVQRAFLGTYDPAYLVPLNEHDYQLYLQALLDVEAAAGDYDAIAGRYNEDVVLCVISARDRAAKLYPAA